MAGGAVTWVVLLAIVWSVGSCAVRAYEEANGPEAQAKRRAEAEAQQIAHERRMAAYDEQIRTSELRRAELEREAQHYAELNRAAAARKRENENNCIRRLGYEECRRIYNPTTAELEAQLAMADRASRVAEAYRGR